ncbi:SigE family RNA polymerase sigma factor [Microlunatus speluncae]|uniref:SigE family RNA polymerase sigma factor n=1 Tax=Microlunatus speluncae TaxID=2594267 RepID=UPI0012661B86|nr:SigE family RNA polymerase sigma factor [Microlunatus speluncae]
MQAINAEVPRVVRGPRDTSLDGVSDSADRTPEFADWVDRSGPALLGFAHMVTGSGHDAADAVQDALVAVYPRWRRLQADDSEGRSFGADAYARRVIVNRTVSWWRKFTRREYLVDAAELPPVRAPGVIESDPAGQVSDSILARQLLGTLPTKQRAAVVLRFYDDLPFAEIADILRCTESTARSYVHRALAALRDRLDDPASASDSDEVNR